MGKKRVEEEDLRNLRESISSKEYRFTKRELERFHRRHTIQFTDLNRDVLNHLLSRNANGVVSGRKPLVMKGSEGVSIEDISRLLEIKSIYMDLTY